MVANARNIADAVWHKQWTKVQVYTHKILFLTLTELLLRIRSELLMQVSKTLLIKFFCIFGVKLTVVQMTQKIKNLVFRENNDRQY